MATRRTAAASAPVRQHHNLQSKIRLQSSELPKNYKIFFGNGLQQQTRETDRPSQAASQRVVRRQAVKWCGGALRPGHKWGHTMWVVMIQQLVIVFLVVPCTRTTRPARCCCCCCCWADVVTCWHLPWIQTLTILLLYLLKLFVLYSFFETFFSYISFPFVIPSKSARSVASVSVALPSGGGGRYPLNSQVVSECVQLLVFCFVSFIHF